MRGRELVEITKMLHVSEPSEEEMELLRRAADWLLPSILRRVSYDFRHTFVTDMLAKGESASFVAALIGHSGTAILEKHYRHLTQRSDALRASLLRRNAVSA